MSGSRCTELRHRIRRRAQRRALRKHPCCPIETHSAISTTPVGTMPQPAKPSKVSLLRSRAQHARCRGPSSVELPRPLTVEVGRPRRMVSALLKKWKRNHTRRIQAKNPTQKKPTQIPCITSPYTISTLSVSEPTHISSSNPSRPLTASRITPASFRRPNR